MSGIHGQDMQIRYGDGARRQELQDASPRSSEAVVRVMAKVNDLNAFRAFPGISSVNVITSLESNQWIVTADIREASIETVRQSSFTTSMEYGHMVDPTTDVQHDPLANLSTNESFEGDFS